MQFGIRELIFVLILLGIPGAWYMAVAKPREAQKAERAGEIARRIEQIKEVSKATAEVEDVQAEIQKLQNAIAHFQNMLPSNREIETLLREVWDLAGEHQLIAKSVRPDQIVPAAQYAELPIRMEIVGDFDGFYSFIRDIEKLPRITRMPRIKVQRQAQDEAGVVKASMTLSIFFEGEQAAS